MKKTRLFGAGPGECVPGSVIVIFHDRTESFADIGKPLMGQIVEVCGDHHNTEMPVENFLALLKMVSPEMRAEAEMRAKLAVEAQTPRKA